MMRPYLQLALVLLAAFVPARAAAQAVTIPEPPAVLRPGDQFMISVWRNLELSDTLLIGANGSPVHPLYRQLSVTGIPLPEVERRVQTFLEGFETEPQFVFEPMLAVSVGGEVQRPALYFLGPATTVSEAIGAAGGPSQFGQLSRVTLRREGTEYLIDLHRANERGGDVPIRSGDMIVVGRRRDIMRDYVAPASSMAAALLALWNILQSL